MSQLEQTAKALGIRGQKLKEVTVNNGGITAVYYETGEHTRTVHFTRNFERREPCNG